MPSFKINEKAISWFNMQYAEDMETDKKLFSVSRISRFTSNTWRCDYAVCLGGSSKRVRSAITYQFTVYVFGL